MGTYERVIEIIEARRELFRHFRMTASKLALGKVMRDLHTLRELQALLLNHCEKKKTKK